MWRSTERSGELVIAGLLFCIGLFLILVSHTMPPGELSVPGPGVFPTMLGGLLCGISIALGIRVLLYGNRTSQQVEIGHPYIWSTVTAIFIVGFLFERLGSILMIAMFVGFLLKILSNLKWIASVLWGFAAGIITYLFFNFLFGVQLPSIPRF